jgi:hypothetical protein
MQKPGKTALDMIGKHAIIPIMSGKNNTKQIITDKIVKRVIRNGRGYVFTASHFADLGYKPTIDLVLSRQAKAGKIRRIARGLYDYPSTDQEMGLLSPSVEAIVKALADAGHLKLQPSGAYAANLLGLSEQVPMKIVFLTDGASRKLKVGKREIILRRTTPRNMAAAGRLGGLVIQALRYIGEGAINPEIIGRLQKAVPHEKREEVLKDSLTAPGWIRSLLSKAFSSGDK